MCVRVTAVRTLRVSGTFWSARLHGRMTWGDRTREKSLRKAQVLLVACFLHKDDSFSFRNCQKGTNPQEKTPNLRFFPETETGSELTAF